MRNLLANAAKYSPAGAIVEVSAEREGEEISVRVLDRGPGIRGEDPERLFSLFYRAPSTASQASGAGIGLFVCDQLIRAMGGRLWAQAREGGGSEFGFALRRYADDEDLAPDADPGRRRLRSDDRGDRAGQPTHDGTGRAARGSATLGPRRSGGTADAADLNSAARKGVRVRISAPAPEVQPARLGA